MTGELQIEAKLLPSRLRRGLVFHQSSLEGERLLPVVRCTVATLSGFGESPPLPTFTGESAEATVAHVRRVAPELSAKAPAEALDELHASPQLLSPQSRAALDIALHDLIAKQRGEPLHALLGTSADRQIRVSRAIGFHTLEQTVALAREYTELGVTALKLKIGRDLRTDADIIYAVRTEVGQATELSVDANESLAARDALRLVEATRTADLAYFEQPVQRHDLEGLRAVRAAGIRVLADESVFTAADAYRLAKAEAADILAIKLIKCGGLRPALEIVGVAREFNLPVVVIDPLGSAVSLNAGLHLAATLGDSDYAHGLSAGLDVTTSYAPHQALRRGLLDVPSGAGLGVEVVWPLTEGGASA